MNYHVFNIRMQKVATIEAAGAVEALEQAKEKWPGASVEKVLTAQEQRYKELQEEGDFWDTVHPYSRRARVRAQSRSTNGAEL